MCLFWLLGTYWLPQWEPGCAFCHQRIQVLDTHTHTTHTIFHIKPLLSMLQCNEFRDKHRVLDHICCSNFFYFENCWKGSDRCCSRSDVRFCDVLSVLLLNVCLPPCSVPHDWSLQVLSLWTDPGVDPSCTWPDSAGLSRSTRRPSSAYLLWE